VVFGQPIGMGVDVNHDVNRHVRLRDANFELGEAPQLVVDANGILLMANQQARQTFNLDTKDLGRPFRDLELSYRPVELRSLIEQACAERRAVRAADVERRGNNSDTRFTDARIVPLIDKEVLLGVCITFIDVTDYHNLQEEVLRARQESETVNEELQSANEELQSTNEEIETTNEELQSTNEELETTNEELQSTNEELETMNEELQSTNEELQTINEELRQRTDQLNESTSFLNSILSSLRGGVVVVDRNFTILVWNHVAEDLWGLRLDEVRGQSLLNLDIGLPVGQLRGAVRASMDNGAELQEIVVDAVNRRGRGIKCRVSVSPFKTERGECEGAVMMMEEMGM
jgi:two-component system CheB/CheR fusion protein